VQSSGDALSDEELRDELMTLLIAGHETTATALAWAFERLTRHPVALARLREGDPAYLDAVIKETLRVRPVVMEVEAERGQQVITTKQACRHAGHARAIDVESLRFLDVVVAHENDAAAARDRIDDEAPQPAVERTGRGRRSVARDHPHAAHPQPRERRPVAQDRFELRQQNVRRPHATGDAQQVILPDLAAGCSMADMAVLTQVEAAWERLAEVGIAGRTVPVTYMNSSADIKGFVGRNGGVVCTSSNAKRALEWAFQPHTSGGAAAGPGKVLFLPDQHLGRNTAVLDMGMPLSDCVLYDPHKPMGGLTAGQLRAAKIILWRGHCSVHGRFTLDSVNEVRSRVPGVNVLVHPECRHEVVTAADFVGSTEYIIRTLDAAPAGSKWAIGTELNLVNRLKRRQPDKQVYFLSPTVCQCATMFRIDAPHLCWAMENLAEGHVVNQISVPDDEKYWARIALERMLEVSIPA